MKKSVVLGAIISALLITMFIFYPSKVECNNCRSGENCETSLDCGELGVCLCWYSGEQESETGTPGRNGICQLQSQ